MQKHINWGSTGEFLIDSMIWGKHCFKPVQCVESIMLKLIKNPLVLSKCGSAHMYTVCPFITKASVLTDSHYP